MLIGVKITGAVKTARRAVKIKPEGIMGARLRGQGDKGNIRTDHDIAVADRSGHGPVRTCDRYSESVARRSAPAVVDRHGKSDAARQIGDINPSLIRSL